MTGDFSFFYSIIQSVNIFQYLLCAINYVSHVDIKMNENCPWFQRRVGGKPCKLGYN